MKKFLQIHMLTSYPPSNLNRDDLGRPKTAMVGGTNRLRISSQSLKRAWRTSSLFQEKLGEIEVYGKTGIRTKRLGEEIYKKFVEEKIKENNAKEWSRLIAEQFGKIKSENEKHPDCLYIEQLAFISPEEQKAVFDLVDKCIKNNKAPAENELKLLRHDNSAADLALFGRMLAASPDFNFEASVQVSHAISVQKVDVEDDFFTAVDDLNRGEEEVGAGHMGDVEFASGIFYTYINIDRDLLLENLEGAGKASKKLWARAIQGIVEAAAKVAPTGKQNSFASRAYSHYIMAEIGDQQPRNLSLAYIKPVYGDMLQNAISVLEETKINMDKAYGKCSDESAVMDVMGKKGTLQMILDFCVKE